MDENNYPIELGVNSSDADTDDLIEQLLYNQETGDTIKEFELHNIINETNIEDIRIRNHWLWDMMGNLTDLKGLLVGTIVEKLVDDSDFCTHESSSLTDRIKKKFKKLIMCIIENSNQPILDLETNLIKSGVISLRDWTRVTTETARRLFENTSRKKLQKLLEDYC